MNCLPYPSYIYTKMPSAPVCVCGAREKGCSGSARDSYSGGGGGQLDPFWDDCCCVCTLSDVSSFWNAVVPSAHMQLDRSDHILMQQQLFYSICHSICI